MNSGDYVLVNPGVHDAAMPENRRDGLIVQVLGHGGWDRVPDQAIVMFSNGAFLKFHMSQLTLLVKHATAR